MPGLQSLLNMALEDKQTTKAQVLEWVKEAQSKYQASVTMLSSKDEGRTLTVDERALGESGAATASEDESDSEA